MHWESFTPVQNKTIPLIMNTEKHLIISSGTASGKTEAAFLPILSKIENNASHSLKVIYISPLKALINNQFERIIDLCTDMDILIHRWHGDVSASKKKKITDDPKGILQITPESIESLFINRTRFLKSIFANVEYIIIDEIHSFIGTKRGVHLRSLLDRLSFYFSVEPRLIGLSATINNFNEVKKWISSDSPSSVEIIESTGYDKKTLYSLMYFATEKGGKAPIELYKDIRELTKRFKAIIFANSRAEVEELTHVLNRLAVREGKEEGYFPHHSSIDKKIREYVEKQMVQSRSPKSIISTSTLELGIDIGDVDLVIQVDNTITVSSLKQRLGRSGRKKGKEQILQLYATKDDSLLQSIAVMELNLEGWIEPVKNYEKPFDIAFHQIISMCAEANGLSINELINKLNHISVFQFIEHNLIQKMIMKMLDEDILEQLSDTKEIIVGIAGEKILRSKEFYAVFDSPDEFSVYHKSKRIGLLDKNPSIQSGNNIILAGKLWTIDAVDYVKNKVYVVVAVNAEPPAFSSGNANVHFRIHEKMLQILCSHETFEYVSEEGVVSLNDLRQPYHYINLSLDERPMWVDKYEVIFEPFAGTIINQTLYWMLKATGLDIKLKDSVGRITIHQTPRLKEKINELYNRDWKSEDIFNVILEHEYIKSKFTTYLPEELKKEMFAAHNFDLKGAMKFLNQIEIKYIDIKV